MRVFLAGLFCLLAVSTRAQMTGVISPGGGYNHYFFASNSASNGYVSGNDANACTSPGTACLTIDAAKAKCTGSSDIVIINPGAGGGAVYTENTGALGYLDFGTACNTITGDQRLAGSTTNPTVVPILRSATNTERVISIPAPAASHRQLLGAITLDAQTTATTAIVAVNVNPDLWFQQVNWINVPTGQTIVGNAAAGTSAHTYDRINIANSVLSDNYFGWRANGDRVRNVTVKGGASQLNGASSRYWWFQGGSWQNILFLPDIAGTLHAFTNGGGTGTPVRFNGPTVTNAQIAVTCTGTRDGCFLLETTSNVTTLTIGSQTTATSTLNQSPFLFQQGTVGTLDIWASCTTTFRCIELDSLLLATSVTIRNGTHSGVTSLAPIWGQSFTCSNITLSGNTLTSGTLGLVDMHSELCGNAVTSNNTSNPTAASSAIQFSWNFSGTQTSTNDRCNIPTNGPRACFTHGDGLGFPKQNQGASTGSQNLGDVAGNAYVAQKFTTDILATSSRQPYLRTYMADMKKNGNPVGTVAAFLCADNAGAPAANCPGSATLATATPISTSLLTTSVQKFNLLFPTPYNWGVNTPYHVVLQYTGTINGSDFVVLDRNGTTTGGAINTGTAALAWTPNAAVALRYIIGSGWYGSTVNYTNPSIVFNDPTDTRELEGINIGPTLGGLITGLICKNCGYGVVVKNTLGSTTINNFLYSSFAGTGSGLYSKGSQNVSLWHGYCLIAGTAVAQCFPVGDDFSAGTPIVNPMVSSNPSVKDVIFNTNAASAPYGIAANTTGTVTMDFNDLFTAGTTIDSVSGANLATWRALGRDVNSITSNPNLVNQNNPSSFSDITPNLGAPVCGTGTASGQPTATDALGTTWKTPPAIGAVECP